MTAPWDKQPTRPHIITVEIPPGATLRVTLAETDGEFIFEYTEDVFRVTTDMPDSSGRDGVIYEELFGEPEEALFLSCSKCHLEHDMITFDSGDPCADDDCDGELVIVTSVEAKPLSPCPEGCEGDEPDCEACGGAGVIDPSDPPLLCNICGRVAPTGSGAELGDDCGVMLLTGGSCDGTLVSFQSV